MKLSKDTIKILDNLSQINDTIIFKQGRKQVVTDISGKILMDVNLEEEFPRRFPIFEVKRLLQAISLFDEPEIEFSETALTIKQGNDSIQYSYCSEAFLKDYKEKNGANLPDAILSFKIDQNTYNKVRTASGIFKSNQFNFRADGKSIFFCTGEQQKGKTIAIEVGNTDRVFDLSVNIDLMRLIKDEEYTFNVHDAGKVAILSIETKTYDAKYVVVCNLDSRIEP
ncbi:DNA polymerase sliding clamp [Ochrobactrum phage vB_OspM_OC]|nr:DNA polymerase sliding clamp [Ochrobactrum phage vB_OspM_OC]